MKALVPAAGKGTRMRGLCDHIPKPLLPVANVPMVGHVLNGLRGAGIHDVAVIVGHMADQVRAAVGDGSRYGVNVTYLTQDTPTGTGSATLLGRDFVADDPFILAFADIIVHPDFYVSFAQRLLSRGCDVLMAVRVVDDPWRGAAVYADEEYRVSKVIEKPKPGTSTTHYDSAGMFAFQPTIFDQLSRLKPSERGEYELTQAIDMAIEEQRAVEAWVIEQYWSNVSSPADLLAINRTILLDQSGDSAVVDSTAKVSPDTELRGPCAIAALCDVAARRLGPNVSLGDGVRVGLDAELEHAVVMPDARVRDGAKLSHAVVGPGVVVPAGAAIEGTVDEAVVV